MIFRRFKHRWDKNRVRLERKQMTLIMKTTVTHLVQLRIQQMNLIHLILQKINARTQLSPEPLPIRSWKIPESEILITAYFHEFLEDAKEFRFPESVGVQLGICRNGGGATAIGAREMWENSRGEEWELARCEAPADAQLSLRCK